MLLFIPLRTDSPIRRFPYVNYALIGLNLVAFMAFEAAKGGMGPLQARELQDELMLNPASPSLFQYITYQFLHHDVMHLIGNMLFLWVFGNSVNSKMGQVPYLLFYLSAGVFAGWGMSLFAPNPVLGASGAIAGVTTAYLVLYPHSEVTVFYWIFLAVGTMHWRATLLIGVKIILWDNLISPNLAGAEESHVAYAAHLAGYLYGFVVALGMLALRALPRDQYDILALSRRAYQRQQMKAAFASPEAQARATYGRMARPVGEHGELLEARPVEEMDEVSRLRLEISQALEAADYPTAVDRYERLVSSAPEQCLPRRQMLDVANQLMIMGKHEAAATAYEKFLKHYGTAAEAPEARLVLGIIYARYLQQYEAAQRHLRPLVGRLSNPDHRRQVDHWLEVAGAGGGAAAS